MRGARWLHTAAVVTTTSLPCLGPNSGTHSSAVGLLTPAATPMRAPARRAAI
jgi:hypothetical protein